MTTPLLQAKKFCPEFKSYKSSLDIKKNIQIVKKVFYESNVFQIFLVDIYQTNPNKNPRTGNNLKTNSTP